MSGDLFAKSVAIFDECNPLMKRIFLLIFILGAFIRLFDAWRPIDRASWRECDLGAISRNYAREGMNPFYPRVDWRGTSPGYAEMEFPVYPYLTAISYKIFGEHDVQARLINFLFSLATLWFFFQLARSFLDEFSSLVAFTFFTFHPMVMEISTSVQPEGLMILCYTASVYFFTRWLKTEENKDFWLATIATMLTILAKATAGHIGLLFGVLLLQKYGFGIFKQVKIWLFGAISLLPALVWYAHAKSLWKNYGNSLGVSNEYHWIGWDFFTNPRFIVGILQIELTHVFLFFGAVICAFAIWKNWGEKFINFCLIWLGAIFLLYVIASRTTSENWATYYHVFSVLPVALLVGYAFNKFFEFGSILNATNLVLIICLLATFLISAKKDRSEILEHRVHDAALACANQFKPLMNKEGLILASGNRAFDEDGYPVAYNTSFMFYWLDRKGFNLADEDQNVTKVQEFSAKGAKYFIAQKNKLELAPNFEKELRQNFKVISECDEMILFDLTENS
ncbi:MAG: glycosyltransferase family 39 protein [Pyrinomonadaceae bacterium]|nr:glycosyltransferase family 39 protein [Pyrinomonadaceae bacterium]